MFGPDSPPMVWDTHRNYSRERVELYYLGNAGPALTQQQLVSAMQGKWPDEGYADKALTRWVKGAFCAFVVVFQDQDVGREMKPKVFHQFPCPWDRCTD